MTAFQSKQNGSKKYEGIDILKQQVNVSEADSVMFPQSRCLPYIHTLWIGSF